MKPGKLSDLVVLQRGFDITKAQQTSGSIPIISSSGPSSFHNQAKCQGPGVITGRKGTLGKVFYSEGSYWPHDTTLWGKDFKGNHPKYVYFFLKLLKLETYDVGASNPTLNRNHLHKIDINIPAPNVQRKIAAVLSAYDDLIDNNNRRIALLEKMGEELYREWFVRLRFPGHESTTIVKGVPEGWTAERFDAVIQTNPSTPIRKGEHADRIEMEDVQTGKKFAFGKAGKQIYSGGARFERGDTIFARITPCLQNGKIAKVNDLIDVAFGSTEFFVFRAIDRVSTSNFVYYLSNSNFVRDTAIASMTGASGRQRADVASVEDIIILRPPFALLEKFESILSPIDRHIQRMVQANQNASESRDRLLTRLMSGKIDLESLDIAFPPSMQEAA